MATSSDQIVPDEGYIHSIETAGTVDGPGIRFVVFLTGCPLRCLYCHNPDTRKLHDGKLTKASDLIREISQYADFFKRTGGGVTISGGEPLLQQDFITEIFCGCKKLGLHTAIDTSGYCGSKIKDELIELTDLFLLDIKAFNADVYKHVTSSQLQPTLDFATYLAEKGKTIWLRYVLVPDLTDQLDDIAKLATFAKNLGNVQKVEVLPFHKMGESKWQALGLRYELTDTQPPSPDLLQKVHDIFAAKGLDVH
ncbi:MAG: pyruvate formate-lyase-activating protein [Alphaproteobacteria bacterium]|jgi:pyruvate formate lyase activating enzyme|nr:pyruvate formate-lyase-activating protein [Alphaproteobacteria bacterium]